MLVRHIHEFFIRTSVCNHNQYLVDPLVMTMMDNFHCMVLICFHQADTTLINNRQQQSMLNST